MKREKIWLCQVPSQTLQQVNKDLDQAFLNFYRGFGYPKFKKKGINDSFRIPQNINLEKKLSKKIGQVNLPKFGKVKFISTRAIEGKIKHVTITKEADKWFISFNCEIEKEVSLKGIDSAIGIDRGIVIFAKCSDNSEIKAIAPLKKNINKIKKLQRKLKKKKKFSSNWKKAIKKLQKSYRYIKNKRKDYLHKVTTQLSKKHGLIVLENLKISKMSKSAKGTIEKPGKNVKAKSGLNRSILDQGWHMFQTYLEYKMKYSGGQVIYVDPKNTSLKCNRCKKIAKENRKSQSKFECIYCGYKANADLNASINILAEGLLVLACGVEALASTMKQELDVRKPIAV